MPGVLVCSIFEDLFDVASLLSAMAVVAWLADVDGRDMVNCIGETIAAAHHDVSFLRQRLFELRRWCVGRGGAELAAAHGDPRSKLALVRGGQKAMMQ